MVKTRLTHGVDASAIKQIARAFHQNKIELKHDGSIVEAFRIIANSALDQVTANAPAVRALDPEAVHQMRIGLRRLRVAISVFSHLLKGKRTERIKRELKWLTSKLGTVRDLDVFLNSDTKLLRSQKLGARKFVSELAAQRATAFEKARDAVGSQRFHFLVLHTQKWIAAGDWTSRLHNNQGIKGFAADVLTSRTKKTIKDGSKLPELDSRRCHKLRIDIKKLRYSSDFFESLFTSHKSKQRLAIFKNCLKALQDRLGDLNDIFVQTKLAAEFGAKDVRTLSVSDRRRHANPKTETLLKGAAKAEQEFACARHFWT